MPAPGRVFVIAGSRDYPDLHQVDRWCEANLKPGDVVISGAARGVDAESGNHAERLGCRVEWMPADWSHGRGAGIKRNAAMLDRLVKARSLGWETLVV